MLESKGHVVLGSPSSAFETCSWDRVHSEAATDRSIHLNRNTNDQFPKTVNCLDPYTFVSVESETVCGDQQALKAHVSKLADHWPGYEVVVQDTIDSARYSLIVIDFGNETTTFSPFVWDRTILRYGVKTTEMDGIEENQPSENGHSRSLSSDIPGKVIEDSVIRNACQEAALSAIKAARFHGSRGLARIDLARPPHTSTLLVTSINPLPHVFSPSSITSDDILISQTIPGGHSALLDMLIAAKKFSTTATTSSCETLASTFDSYSTVYHDAVSKFEYYRKWQALARAFDYTGTVADLACGTGILGQVLHESGNSATITGMDLSPQMTAHPVVQKHYELPIRIGAMQDFVMQPQRYDHVACLGALHFLDPVTFSTVLSRMFVMATKSISFDVEYFSPAYLAKMKIASNEVLPSWNHGPRWKGFLVPSGWKVVSEEYGLLYHYEEIGENVEGWVVRVERT